jgi:hypothetical protein
MPVSLGCEGADLLAHVDGAAGVRARAVVTPNSRSSRAEGEGEGTWRGSTVTAVGFRKAEQLMAG